MTRSAAKAEVLRIAMSTPEDRAESRTGSADATPRILVVDDDRAVRLVLARALARAGYEVFLADSGSDALDQLEHRRDLIAVLSDIAMPAMSGIELATEVLRRYPGLPVLFVTSTNPDAALLDHPLVGVVHKPVAIAELRTALATLIGRAGAPAASAAHDATGAEG
jgi:CheY-like chemotaxis protein